MYLMKPEDFEPWVGRTVRTNTITLARLERKPVFLGAERKPSVPFGHRRVPAQAPLRLPRLDFCDSTGSGERGST
jgi:hypothetical protein